jgi:hypothetical protein
MVAGTRCQLERCARLFGVTEGLLKAVGSPVYDYYEPDPRLYERTLSTARSRLGQAAFEEAWDRGRAMSFEQAVVYALEEGNGTAYDSIVGLTQGPSRPCCGKDQASYR